MMRTMLVERAPTRPLPEVCGAEVTLRPLAPKSCPFYPGLLNAGGRICPAGCWQRGGHQDCPPSRALLHGAVGRCRPLPADGDRCRPMATVRRDLKAVNGTNTSW